MQYESRPIPAAPGTPLRNACRRNSPAMERPWPADNRRWSAATCRPADECVDRSTTAAAIFGWLRRASFRRRLGHDIALGVEVIAVEEGLRMHLLSAVIEVDHFERQGPRPDYVIAAQTGRIADHVDAVELRLDDGVVNGRAGAAAG